MKKFICILVLILMIPIVTGCFQKQQDTLSFEEIMSLSNVELGEKDVLVSYDDLHGFVSDFSSRNIDVSLVTASVKEVSYYLTWDKEYAVVEGYTETEICIDTIATEYNDVSLSVGDTIIVRQDYYIGFEKEAGFISYVEEKTNKSIDTIEDLIKMDSFTLELELFKNEEYQKYIHENEMPLKKGETYTMAICDSSGNNNEYYSCYYVAPISMSRSIDSFANSYDLIFSDVYISIANEIKNGFAN